MKQRNIEPSGRTILLVDDNVDYLEAMRLLLEREGHHVLSAFDGAQALRVLRENPVDLLLLDYFMPGMTAEEVVGQLRNFDPYVQIILQTGYVSDKPPRDMLRRLNIQGYYDKGEGPDKFLMWVDVGLKAASTVQFLNANRQGLAYVLDVTPALHKIQPLEELLPAILNQLAGLFEAANSAWHIREGPDKPGLPEGARVDGFLAMLEDDSELFVRANLGQFALSGPVSTCRGPEQAKLLSAVLQGGEVQYDGSTAILPLRVGSLSLGVIYLEWEAVAAPDAELLQIFINQAAVAIQNVQLYALATLDPLTNVYVRGFFEQWLLRELRAALRKPEPVSLLMVDLDGLKHINDTYGHLTGDLALAEVGNVLRRAVRTSDVVGRYGGDEFAVILPQTPPEGAESVGQRVLDLMLGKALTVAQTLVPLAASVGLGSLSQPDFEGHEVPYPISQSYFQMVAQTLILRADEALYQAKREGGSRFRQMPPASWPVPAAAPEPSPDGPERRQA
jgi:two-component system cell cycle response regulator